MPEQTNKLKWPINGRAKMLSEKASGILFIVDIVTWEIEDLVLLDADWLKIDPVPSNWTHYSQQSSRDLCTFRQSVFHF